MWCLWKYWPDDGRKRGECPCHGSMYDPDNWNEHLLDLHHVQAAPSNTLPKLNFEVDSDGFVFILPPKFNANDNGVVGYGRFA